MSFRAKILVMIIILTGFVSIATSSIYYSNTIKTIETNHRQSVTQHIRGKVSLFDNMMKQMYYATLDLCQDLELIELVKREMQGEDVNLELSSFLYRYRLDHENVDSLYVYIPKENVVVKSQEYKAVVRVVAEDSYEWLREVRGKASGFTPSIIIDEIGSAKKWVFMYSKPLIDPETGNYIGEVCLNMDERVVFYSCLDELYRYLNGEVVVLNQEQVIASSEEISNIGQYNGNGQGENDYEVIDMVGPFTNYHIFAQLNFQSLTEDMRGIRNLIMLVAFISVVVTLIIAFLLTNKMYARVRGLKQAMSRLSQGDMRSRAVPKGNDEISELTHGFNHMAFRMESLIEEIINEKLLKKEAEIEALQYQITPHFMYNTLNSIKCAAYLNSDDDVGDLLEAFIELLQSSISKKGAFITLQEELDLVENYLMLQRYRLNTAFEVIYDIEEATRTALVPRLLIQPLIENSIFHGLNTKKGKSEIRIQAYLEESKLNLTVMDNGKGMSLETLEKVFEKKQSHKEKFNHIGICNIRERIHLYYGDKGLIRFESEEGKGVRVFIKIPFELGRIK